MSAAVGVISVRVAAQLNNAVVAVGNLSRLSGSLDSVLVALAIPTMQSRLDIAEPVVAITAEHIDYAYGNHHALKGISLTVTQGFPLVLRGRSGRGKTTLANVLAGIYSPMSGVVRYVGVSGKFYDSGRYRAKIGYVTQDVHLFCGSFRENLSAGRSCSDDEIWAELEQVDAAEFIRQLGGLDATMAEAGRSLSGGQRRRLGIARVLLARREILILDEITSGLDQLNREMIIQLIEKISLRHVVIIISHEYLPFAHAREYVLD
jgi:ABC-type multidrug transport system fused ATPase/permease subunit